MAKSSAWPWVLGGVALVGTGVLLARLLPGSPGVLGPGAYNYRRWPDAAAVQQAFADFGYGPISMFVADPKVLAFQVDWNTIVAALRSGASKWPGDLGPRMIAFGPLIESGIVDVPTLNALDLAREAQAGWLTAAALAR